MALKPNIFYNVNALDVAKKLPKEFQRIVDCSQLKDDSHTVISFSGMRGESTSIVDSKTFSKVLAKARTQNELIVNQPIVVVAHNFTSEACDLMEELGIIYFHKSDFFWTDERWHNIRDQQ